VQRATTVGTKETAEAAMGTAMKTAEAAVERAEAAMAVRATTVVTMGTAEAAMGMEAAATKVS
jgi:hypothetical protein